MPPPNETHVGRGRQADGTSADPSEPVSANPAAMRTYTTDAAEKTDELRTLIGEVSVALANYRQNAVLAGAGFDPQNELSWHDGWTDAAGAGAIDALLDLCDDFDHLDAFVGSVADAVYEAEGLDDGDPRADQVYSLTAGDIADHGDIDGARREFSNEDAQRDVEELRRLCEELDIDFDDFSGERLYLPDDDLNRELYDHLVSMMEHLDDDTYASTLFNDIGVSGTQVVTSYITRLWLHGGNYDELPDDLDARDDLLAPLADAFAGSTHTLDPALLDEFLAAENPGSLAMLLSGDGSQYEAQFLAHAADIVLNSDLPPTQSIYPYHPELLVTRQTALETLGENPAAAWTFVSSRPGGLEYILQGPPEGDAEAAQVFAAAFLQAPLDNPEIYPDARDLYADVVRIVGEGNVPDELRIATAGSLVLYIDDIGDAALTQRRTDYNDEESMTSEDFNRPDLVNFFEELGHNEQATMLVGAAIMTWSAEDLEPYISNTELSADDMLEERLLRNQGLIMGAVQDGLDQTDNQSEDWLSAGINLAGAAGLAALMVFPEPLTTTSAVALAGGGAATGWSLPRLSNWIAGETSTSDRPEMDGRSFEDMIVRILVEASANAITEQHSGPSEGVEYQPEPSEYDNILDQHFPMQGHPFDELDLNASDQQTNYEASSHW